MFYPGETVEQTFIVPFYESDIGEAIVTYKQNSHVVLNKVATSEPIYEEVEYENEEPVLEETGASKLIVRLTEKESLLFKEGNYSMQINIFNLGKRQTSKHINSKCGDQFLRKTYDNISIINNDTPEVQPEEESEEVTEDV